MDRHNFAISASTLSNSERPAADLPFGASIRSLLEITAEETGARGYALYLFDEARRSFVSRLTRGLPSRQPASYPVTVALSALRLVSDAADDGPALISLPLRGRAGLAGVVDFGFDEPRALDPVQLAIVHKTAEAIERLLHASQLNPVLGQLADRIAQLERVLAEQVISERARGLTENPDAATGRAEVLFGHIDRVLGSSRAEQSLHEQLQDLESRINARRLLSAAKQVLQKRLGVTEEQAYLTLRSRSRRSRTPLLDIARQILEGAGRWSHSDREQH